MKKKILPRLLIPVVLIALVAGGTVFYIEREHVPTNTLRLYGNVDIRQIQAAFQATGRVTQLLVHEGDRIKKGQLLGVLDSSRYEAAVSKAGAEAEAQKEVLARLLAGSRPEEIAQARARVRAAQATLTDTRNTFRRMDALSKKQFVSQQIRDNAEAAYQAAQAELDSANEALTLAIKGPREEDIATARRELKAKEAALDFARIELADTRLYAPASGTIRERILEPGDMAFPQSPIYTLALDQPVWVRVYVGETDLGKIAPGMKAIVRTDSFPDKTYEGWIGYISPTAEFTPKQVETAELRTRLVYQVRVYVCQDKNELRLGMPATVDISLLQLKPNDDNATSIPCQES
jgi:HlyD family secretion protein